MSDQSKIPVLTDLVEKGGAIKMSDLGLDDTSPRQDPEPSAAAEPDVSAAAEAHLNNPLLEQTIRNILDEHLELAWQEIKLAIKLDRDL